MRLLQQGGRSRSRAIKYNRTLSRRLRFRRTPSRPRPPRPARTERSRNMGVHEARGTLSKAMKELMLRWADVKANWDDVQSSQFEETYLRNLEADLRVAAAAMDQVGQMLHQVRRDCE